MSRRDAAGSAFKLGRARGRLRRFLADGWLRVVFSRPQVGEGPREERVVEGPGAGPVDAALFERWLERCEHAASEGLVKQCFVLDLHRRVELDARHGIPRLCERDAASLRKVMGGKSRTLRPDDSAELLRAIGIMNADGSISAKNAKKYKQVNHLVELCRPAWESALRRRGRADSPLRVLDLACGNSTLDFVLAEALRLAEVPAILHGVDRRGELIDRCRARARTLAWPHLHFAVGEIRDAVASSAANLGGPPDLVLALHACDTATDDALALAIEIAAPAILCVPCCQAELARQLARSSTADGSSGTTSPTVPALLEHGLLRRAYADALTDALRVELLGACGYEVQVLEFVASEHTPKNLLLRAHLRGGKPRPREEWELDRVRDRCRGLGVDPALLSHLEQLQRTATDPD